MTLPSRTRNAAAGTVRQLDPEVAQGRPLQFFAHSAGEGIDAAGHHELMDRLVQMGFQIADLTRACDGMDQVIEAIQAIGAARNDLPYEIDGAVVKVNDTELQAQLGFVSEVLAGPSRTSTRRPSSIHVSRMWASRSDGRVSSRP